MDKDLSNYHQPVNGTLTDPKDCAGLLLTTEQLAFFEKFGYLKSVKILDDDQIEELCSDLAGLMAPGQGRNPLFYEYHQNESLDPGKTLFHALGAWRVSRSFHDLLFNPAFTFPSRQLLGGPVRFWHDQLFVKPARDGGVVAWHQDYSYWTRTKPMAHLTCWIGLDDSTSENGCVHYVPGSHKWNLLPRTDLANDMEAIFGVLTDEQKRQFKPVAIEMKRGEASFHHPMMVHGSFENRSGNPRRACVINVFRDGVVSGSDEPLLEGVPPIEKGERIEGRFFPLLLS